MEKVFWKSGHVPTLISAFLYFDVSFMVWMTNAAIAPFITQQLHLTPSQNGMMLFVPVFAGAFLRIPLGLAAEIIGRKNAALIGLTITILGMLYGYWFVSSYTEVIILGGFLGIAGASFSVALPLGSGWFPAKYQGLAMGIVGAGNSGTIFAGFFAPKLASIYNWNVVYGFFAIPVVIVMLIMLFLAKEPPSKSIRKSLMHHLKVIVEKDIWIFNLLYWVTFGGFLGIVSFVPTFMADQYGVNKISAGQFMILVGFSASLFRIVGGGLSDRVGGIKSLYVVYVLLILCAIGASFIPSISLIFLILFLLAATMGVGNGSIFQLLPLRFPHSKATSAGVVGEFGALGGAFIPLVMGYSKEIAGTYSYGFILYAITAVVALCILLIVRKRWTTSWVGKGGKALDSHDDAEETTNFHPAKAS